MRDGDFVGVVAPTERAVRRAAAAVKANWKPLAGQPSSQTIFDHLKRGTTSGRAATPFTVGDAAAALAGAARTFDASYRIPYIAHVPLEPRAAVAEWSADGKLTVWAGTQRPFGVRVELATAFRLPEDRVRVIVPDTGSAYGGKHTGEHAIEAARLAKAAGKPVKLVWTRAEEFTWGYLRPAGVIDIKAGVDAAGRLVAWEFDNWNSGSSGDPHALRRSDQRIVFHAVGLTAPAGLVSRPCRDRQPLRARDAHGRDGAGARRGCGGVPAPALEGRADARRAHGRRRASRLAEAVRRRARALGIACGTEKGSYVATAAEVSQAGTGFRVER